MTQKTMWSMENTPSRFIRTTWLLSAVTELKLQVVNASIRRISVSESASLAEYTRKRNVFARHAGENSFYFQRAKQLADKTVVEVYVLQTSSVWASGVRQTRPAECTDGWPRRTRRVGIPCRSVAARAVQGHICLRLLAQWFPL